MSKHSTELKRIPIKFIRDKAKAAYKKGSLCEICETDQELEFHHYHTLTPLWEKWAKERKIVIKTDEDILAVRDQFIAENHDELYIHAVTLCKTHHSNLHKVYGKAPDLSTDSKQKNWVKIQREKHEVRKLAV
jgi:hypothetical protein